MSQDSDTILELRSRLEELQLELAKRDQQIKQLEQGTGRLRKPTALVRPVSSSEVARGFATTVPPVTAIARVTGTPAIAYQNVANTSTPVSASHSAANRNTPATASHNAANINQGPSTDTVSLCPRCSRSSLNTAASALRQVQLSERLIYHVQAGELDKVRELVSQGADPSYRYTQDGFSALNRAVFLGHVDLAVFLMDAGVPLDDDRSGEGRNPLHTAAAKGHLQLVHVLLGAGASVDVTDNKGLTPLMLAAYFGHVLCVRALVQAGADVSLKERSGSTAKMLAKNEKIRNVLS